MARYAAFFLVGPTAVGKTAVAHHLALQRGADILSADSMLVYRGLDVGTAKPTPPQRAEVRYRAIDVVEPGDRFSVGAYRALAEGVIREASDAGRVLFVVGGTGLYIKALTDGLAILPDHDPESRRRWESVWREEGTGRLAGVLRERSPELYATLADPHNPRRLIRALELTDAGLTTRAATWKREPSVPIVGLRSPSDLLRRRIEERVAAMYRGGLLAEAERLLSAGIERGGTALQAIGYAEAIACVRGECSQVAAVEKTAARTRQLARRQMTWFRHQAHVAWLDIDAGMDAAAIAGRVADEWSRIGPTPIAGMD